VNIFASKRGKSALHTQYAAEADFCRIFEKDMNRLYLLSLLLTADSEWAEKCFVAGLEDSKNSNPVFKEWAQSWARRTIIMNAIRMLAPRPERTLARARSSHVGKLNDLPADLAAVGELSAFERFVFVMSVLEGYSDRECSLLLNCSGADVVIGRTRALQQLASVGARQKLANIRDSQSQGGDSEVALAQEMIPRMAATA